MSFYTIIFYITPGAFDMRQDVIISSEKGGGRQDGEGGVRVVLFRVVARARLFGVFTRCVVTGRGRNGFSAVADRPFPAARARETTSRRGAAPSKTPDDDGDNNTFWTAHDGPSPPLIVSSPRTLLVRIARRETYR